MLRLARFAEIGAGWAIARLSPEIFTKNSNDRLPLLSNSTG
jgi:hypothetical protein